MAKYDFNCEKCKTNVELEIPMSEYNEVKDKQVCSKCGSKLVRVLVPVGEPIYNCGGFYVKP